MGEGGQELRIEIAERTNSVVLPGVGVWRVRPGGQLLKSRMLVALSRTWWPPARANVLPSRSTRRLSTRHLRSTLSTRSAPWGARPGFRSFQTTQAAAPESGSANRMPYLSASLGRVIDKRSLSWDGVAGKTRHSPRRSVVSAILMKASTRARRENGRIVREITSLVRSACFRNQYIERRHQPDGSAVSDRRGRRPSPQRIWGCDLQGLDAVNGEILK